MAGAIIVAGTIVGNATLCLIQLPVRYQWRTFRPIVGAYSLADRQNLYSARSLLLSRFCKR